MKIIKKYRYDEEPNQCQKCHDEWNGFNHIFLSLYKGITIKIDLCDECLEKLKEAVKCKKK